MTMMMNLDPTTVIIDDEPLREREDRPRSRTWPILPPPIETIHEHERDAEIAEPPPIIEEVEPEEEEENEAQKTETNPRKNSRKNAWGNLSYADLITQAIQSSPEQRLTLSQIYEWMVRNIPYFKDKGDSTSSAGWKNSIRHNLSLHSRFMRVQNDNNGKSSYWVINPDAKPGKSSRRRSGSVDGQPKSNKKRSKKYQSTDDISALSPNAMKMMKNRSYDNLLFAPSPCSSTDSLSNPEEYHGNELSYPYAGDSFARPRSTSNVSTQSSINGRSTPPPHMELDDMLTAYEDKQIGSSGVADDIQSMTIETNNYNTTIPNTINLNDSMKLQTRRPHSDSFGSGDSGYESPVFPSPIGQMPTNRPTMNKLPSPNLVPNKPPPPYSTNFHNQMRAQTNAFNASYYTQQQQQQQQQQKQQRLNMMNNQIPRLKHLPITSQGTFQTNQTNFQTQRLPNNRTFPTTGIQQQQQQNTLQNNIFDNYLPKNNGIIPNITVENKIFHPQPRQQKGLYNNDDIPMDLHQVKLFGFDDQQQLASDLDTIINNEMEASNLKSICEPYKNDTNNNTNHPTNSNLFNTQQVSAFPGQHWVR